MNDVSSPVKSFFAASKRVTFANKVTFHASLFVLALLILFSRRPDALLNAQFYAEDGTYWYADAYNYSWHCIFMPEAGYLHTVPRLVALFSLLFPFALAPLVMNLVALWFQILPIHIFLSSRFGSIRFTTRALCSVLYLALPNSFEIHANTTNIQWHLALICCMVLLARPPETRFWKIFDISMLVLASIDSPLGVPLLALAVAVWWFRRDQGRIWALLALIPGTVIETCFLLFSHSRRDASNGASLSRLAGILGGQVFMSSVLGMRTFIKFHYGHDPNLFMFQLIALSLGAVVVIYAVRYAPLELRLFIIFAAAVLAMALRRPLASTQSLPDQWAMLLIPGVGNRYYFLPMIAFLGSLVWMIGDSSAPSKIARYLAIGLMLLVPLGIYRDWQYKPFVDFKFSKHVEILEQSPPGTRVVIPINPIWTAWKMELVKR